MDDVDEGAVTVLHALPSIPIVVGSLAPAPAKGAEGATGRGKMLRTPSPSDLVEEHLPALEWDDSDASSVQTDGSDDTLASTDPGTASPSIDGEISQEFWAASLLDIDVDTSSTEGSDEGGVAWGAAAAPWDDELIVSSWSPSLDDQPSHAGGDKAGAGGEGHVMMVDMAAVVASPAFGVQQPGPTLQLPGAGVDLPPALPGGVMLESLRSDSGVAKKKRARAGHDAADTCGSGQDREAACPVCHAEMGSSEPEQSHTLGSMIAPNRFARYVPRTQARKDNRMATWYAKYGYCGPKYCKACAESFNSHLLKKEVRSKRARCTRADPCDRCTIILGNFDAPKDRVFEAVDEAKKEMSARKKHKKLLKLQLQQGQEKEQPPPPPPPPSSSGAAGDPEKPSPPLDVRSSTDLPEGAGSSKKQVVQLAVASAVALVTFSALAWNQLGSSQPQPPARSSADSVVEHEWVCGPAAAAKVNASLLPSDLDSICKGLPLLSTVPCDVNDCAEGQVPIGQRTCRCDGCFRAGGRCAGWVLQGFGPDQQEQGCETTIKPDPKPYRWPVPGSLTQSGCDDMCGKAGGCYTADLKINNQDPTAEAQCELVFPRAWPQPLLQAWSDNPVAPANGDRLAVSRTGRIWTKDSEDDAGDIWYHSDDDGGFVSADTFMQLAQETRHDLSIDGTASPSADLAMTWKFDSSGSQTWSSVPSSLNVRPSPRFGAASWVDSTGSLFLVGGESILPIYTVGGMVPFSDGDAVPAAIYDQRNASSLRHLNDMLELWKYDTDAAAWQPLHTLTMPQKRMKGSHQSEAVAWPSPRYGAAVWRDRARLLSYSDSEPEFIGTSSPESETHQADGRAGATSAAVATEIWMFGGWPDIQRSGRASAELWQYVYNHDASARAAEPSLSIGRWTLVTAQSDPNDDEAGTPVPLYECTERPTYPVFRCPPARKDAAAFPSPNGAAGESTCLLYPLLAQPT